MYFIQKWCELNEIRQLWPSVLMSTLKLMPSEQNGPEYLLFIISCYTQPRISIVNVHFVCQSNTLSLTFGFWIEKIEWNNFFTVSFFINHHHWLRLSSVDRWWLIVDRLSTMLYSVQITDFRSIKCVSMKFQIKFSCSRVCEIMKRKNQSFRLEKTAIDGNIILRKINQNSMKISKFVLSRSTFVDKIGNCLCLITRIVLHDKKSSIFIYFFTFVLSICCT